MRKLLTDKILLYEIYPLKFIYNHIHSIFSKKELTKLLAQKWNELSLDEKQVLLLNLSLFNIILYYKK